MNAAEKQCGLQSAVIRLRRAVLPVPIDERGMETQKRKEANCMLVLSRKISEHIVIGEPPNEVRIKVVDIVGGCKVRLGITAERRIPVHLWEKQTPEQMAAHRAKVEEQRNWKGERP